MSSLHDPDFNVHSQTVLPTRTEEREDIEEREPATTPIFAQRRPGTYSDLDSKAVQRRRRWNNTEKKSIVTETEAPGASISAVARKYGIAPRLLFAWRRQLHEELMLTTKSGAKIVPVSVVKDLQTQIQSLEEQLEAKVTEIASLKEALQAGRGN